MFLNKQVINIKQNKKVIKIKKILDKTIIIKSY